MSIHDLQRRCHESAVENGWWDPNVMPYTAVDAVTFGDKIALMHTELSEAYEEYRAGNQPHERYYCDKADSRTNQAFDVRGRPNKPEGIPSELADVIIRILDFAGFAGIDMEQVIMEKLAYNDTRGFRHGGKAS